MRASDPTTAAKQVSKISVASGGTPLAAAAFKPLPLGGHPPQVSNRASGAPVQAFHGAAVPHMVHPNSGIGLPASGSGMTVHVKGVK